ncbi:ead/Ea22-like family protein [Pseudomonas typographi]|uniref:ead/Ea22-like family protein n=1 Tax=Pseudomonas typographi TaxID=2715964 RepID=UPI0016820ACF|nr:ead/Ea22-like family protein [Pseudomonas typographi]MBD1590231.1 hypothetical protein [Pseudomonas typographi]
MTIDYAELKRLAEAATPGPWSARTDDLCYAVTTLGRFRIIVGSAPADDPEPDALFIAAANPAAVLELIAELESANARLHEVAVACATAEQERDQLKAENEPLRKDAERYRWFRNQHWDGSAICAVVDPKQSTKLGAYCPSEKLLDEAIDAALTMSKEASHG